MNYTDEKVDKWFISLQAAQRGSDYHDLAQHAIRLGVKLQGKGTLALYVNDAIGFGMRPEQVLFYSFNAFGTTDAIQWYERKNLLRIHDLKMGVTPASFNQLKVYNALFCLEYAHKPHEIEAELRIYQENVARIFTPDPDEIVHIMDRIMTIDRRIEELRKEAQ